MSQRPSHRILIADDDRDTADSLADLLGFEGYEVQTAYDGRQAVQATEHFRPHIVILDIHMPLLDGFDAAVTIRRQPKGAELILVAHTSVSSPDELARLKRVGFDHYVSKPPAPGAISQLVLQCVEGLELNTLAGRSPTRPGLSRLT